jgi:hypothetical protein
MSETIVKNCKCEHAYQDEKYGRGKRLHNALPNGGARCTVCGLTTDKGSEGKKKK